MTGWILWGLLAFPIAALVGGVAGLVMGVWDWLVGDPAAVRDGYCQRAEQQQAWLDAGDLRGMYGDFMPPAMFLEPEQCASATMPSNDGTPLLTRAAAMIKRAEYVEKQWGVVKATIDTTISVEMMAIKRFIDRCSRREGMTYPQFVDYVRSSAAYAAAGDGSMPLTALDLREMAVTTQG